LRSEKPSFHSSKTLFSLQDYGLEKIVDLKGSKSNVFSRQGRILRIQKEYGSFNFWATLFPGGSFLFSAERWFCFPHKSS
jgi:hypothetical protein